LAVGSWRVIGQGPTGKIQEPVMFDSNPGTTFNRK